MSDKRTRLQLRFWLDVTKTEEDQLAEQVASLKKNRQFADYVRNGLRLMLSLAAGEVDVLIELFPWILEKFNGQAVQVASSKTAKNADILELKRMIEYQQQLMMGIAAQQAQSQTKSAGPQPLPAKSLAMPRFEEDDEELELVLKPRADTGQSGLNFINSVQKLLQ